MRNPELTRDKIISVSSKLFNIQGYKATSISDITKAADLTKGAIYSHFENKSQLEKAALVYMTRGMVVGLTKDIKEGKNVEAKMNAVFDYFQGYSIENHEYGGCPILNAAVEADDTNPELRKVVNIIIETILAGICTVMENGVRRNQLNADINIKEFAKLLFSSIEGAIMLSRVTGDSSHMETVVKHLKSEFAKMLI